MSEPEEDNVAMESERSGRGRAIGIGAVGLTIVVVAVIAAVLLSRPTDPNGSGVDPTAGGSAGPSPGSSASPVATEPSQSVSPTSETIPPVSAWQEAAAFGGAGAIERAESVTRTADGFIAVGTHYGVESMPHSGPVPQEGRVWHSTDGRSWEDVTPAETFADAGLSHVYATDEGALIALGILHEASEDATPMAWESADGRDWSPTPIGLRGVNRLVHGARGYLALSDSSLWLSADGRNWELVRAAASATGEQFLDIGAGDDGFAATGVRGDDFEPFTIASSDGRTWIEASAAPDESGPIAERGGDWVAIGRGAPGAETPPTEASVWSSVNGLEWEEVGTIPLYTVGAEPDGTVVCSDIVVDLHSAGAWLIANATAGYGLCSEGRIETYGSQSISRDGRAWEVLPFLAPGEGGRGSQVNGAIVEEETLILIGHTGSRAMFWFNEAP